MQLTGVRGFQSVVTGVALAVASLYGQVVNAGQQDFVLENATGVDIYQLYVSPASSDQWEEDVLGVDVLEAGDSVEISFDREEDAAYWDLMVMDEAGDSIQWGRLKLTEISEVKLMIKNGQAIAEVQ